MASSFLYSPDHPPLGFAARVDALVARLVHVARLRPCVYLSRLAIEDNVLVHAISVAAFPIDVVVIDALRKR